MHDVLTAMQLAEFLQLRGDTELLGRLLLETSLPRFFIAGDLRFSRSRVLRWLEDHEGRDLLPPQVHETVVEVAPEPSAAEAPLEVAEVPPLHPSAPGETSWLPPEAVDALLTGAGDPGRNLDRLKVRDALLELNDAVLPTLTRLSTGLLHPHHDEKSRTSPWRLDLDADRHIDAIGIAWGRGEHAPAQFSDRPHLVVEFAGDRLRVRLETLGRAFNPQFTADERRALAAAGFEIDLRDESPLSLAKTYGVPSPAPGTSTVARALEADFERLVPLWMRLG